MSFQRGEEVEIRTLAEIRATLDGRGTVGGVPFMPEMERFAGRSARVWRRADRVCVEGSSTLRSLEGFVFLEDLRCDGSAHGGCHRSCLLLWSEAWLRRPGEPGAAGGASAAPEGVDEARLFCQSTALLPASRPVASWRPDAYARDLRTGNLSFPELAYALAVSVGSHIEGFFSSRKRAARAERTPEERLGLAVGEWVEVRGLEEIERTLDANQKNRGLEFAPGMSRYCGRRYRVARRLERMVLETTGELREIHNTVLLEGLNCDGACARGCPRSNPLYWREIWLKRAPGPGEPA